MAANDTESTPLSTSEAGLDLSCARTDDARWRSLEERQALLQRLVVGALCGLMLQACCIYRLIGFAVSSNAAGLNCSNDIPNEILLAPKMLERRPAAHLKDWNHTFLYQMDFLNGMDYKDGLLTVRQEGFYFLYSKVSFRLKPVTHKVMMKTSRYAQPLELMSVRYTYARSMEKNLPEETNSYLGGAFFLSANDSIFLKLEGGEGHIRPGNTENFFGAFML